MSKTATLTVQQWGNSLAVRIPSAIAKSAGFKLGQPVQLSAQESRVLVMAVGPPQLTLAQKLAAFDSERRWRDHDDDTGRERGLLMEKARRRPKLTIPGSGPSGSGDETTLDESIGPEDSGISLQITRLDSENAARSTSSLQAILA